MINSIRTGPIDGTTPEDADTNTGIINIKRSKKTFLEVLYRKFRKADDIKLVIKWFKYNQTSKYRIL